MAKIGYERTSTRGQTTDSQHDELEAYGCDKIFTDAGVSGKHGGPPGPGRGPGLPPAG